MNIVRNIGDLKRARNVDGQIVERQDYIMFHGKRMRCLNTDTHFIYRSKRMGSAALCTCGSNAVSVGYHAYRNFSSYIGNEVVACYHLIMSGKHADGSS